MPRTARIVVPGCAHHVTQRGSNQRKVFFNQQDRSTYLDLLRTESGKTQLEILAYCLMPNHIHLVCLPHHPDSMAVCLRRVHGRYAQYLNAKRQTSGHVWQARYYSCPLDPDHLWNAIRYVERNPVRAHLVEKPEDYRHSSASVHFGGPDRLSLLQQPFWAKYRPGDWRARLHLDQPADEVYALRKATYSGKPFGAFQLRFQTQNSFQNA